MPIIDELGLNTEAMVEIIDFMHDQKFQPKNQQKYFFDDSMSYYQQLCKITKLLTDFQSAFGVVYQNELNLADNMILQEDLDNAIADLKTLLESEIDAVDRRVDGVAGDLESLGRTVAGHTDSIGIINHAIELMEGNITALQTGLNSKLNDVVVYGTGFVEGSSSIVDHVKYMELNVESEAGGTVTSITAGTGLTGGTITGEGTIAIDDTVVALQTDLPDLTDYVEKSDASGYDDILTQTSASAIYQTKVGMSDYVAKADATGYDDILTQTVASTTYTPLSNDVVSNDTLNEIADMLSPQIIAKGSSDVLAYGSDANSNPTIDVNYSLYGASGETTGQGNSLVLDKTYFNVTSDKLGVNESAFPSKSVKRENISVSLVPTSYVNPSWDTAGVYDYHATVQITGITANTLIKDIVMDDTLLDASAPYIGTMSGAIEFYLKTSTTITGTIYLLVTEEI